MKSLWLISLPLGLGLMVSASAMLHKVDSLKSPDWYETRFTYLPSGKILKPVLLGHHQAVASLLWVKAMLYFSEAYLEGNAYPWLEHIVKIVIALDPDFRQAYKYGGLILSDRPESLKGSVEVLTRGAQRFPQDRNLRIMAAFNRLSLDSNYAAAAEILNPLAKDKSAPPYMQNLAATLVTKDGDKNNALVFLMRSYLASTSPLNREILIKKMAGLFNFETSRKQAMVAVVRVLQQTEAEPQFFQIAQTVLREILTSNLSQNSCRLLDLLEVPAVCYTQEMFERESNLTKSIKGLIQVKKENP